MSYYLGLSILSNDHNANGNADGANPQKGRQTRLSAEARRILSQFAGSPLAEDAIDREGQGRPFFTDRELPGRERDFSISHSGSFAAVSFIAGKNRRTGCDVELVRKRPTAAAIAAEFFSAPENDYIISQGHFDETKFYQIWTLKESYLKLRGLSVFDIGEVPSFIHDGNFAFGATVTSPLSFRLYTLGDENERYILATAFEGTEAEAPEMRWFSQASLSCKNIAKGKFNLAPLPLGI